MASSSAQSQSTFLNKILSVARNSFHDIYAASCNWRLPSLRSTLSCRRVTSDHEFVGAEASMLKRRRESDVEGLCTRLDPLATDDANTQLQMECAEAEKLPQVTTDIVEYMQKLAKYRKKLEILREKCSKWQRLVASREQKVMELEKELDLLAVAPTSDPKLALSIEDQLEPSRSLCEEAVDRLNILRRSLMVYESNAMVTMARLEDALGQLLSGRGLFDDPASESEVSEHNSSRSSKRARTNNASMERPLLPDPETKTKREAVVRLFEARAQYQEIEATFENRSQIYKESLENWEQLVAAGKCNMTRTEFDVQWCAEYGDLGIDLHEAELARSRAAVAVMKLNALPITFSQTSKFPNDPEDAEGLENEAKLAVAMLDTQKVAKWLRGINEESSANETVDVVPDDWDVRSMQFGESCSGIADGWVKVRLDRWNKWRKEDWATMKNDLGEDVEGLCNSSEARGTVGDECAIVPGDIAAAKEH